MNKVGQARRMIVSTRASAKWSVGTTTDASAAVFDTIGRGGRTVVGLIASFIAWRTERRLLSTLESLDDRLLDDIGIDRARLGRLPSRHR